MIISANIVAQLQKQQEKNLLEHAVQSLRLADYGKKGKLLPNSSNNVVRFFRRAPASLTATGAPTVLTEGGQTLQDRDFPLTPVDISLTQYGQTTRVSDIVNNVGLVTFIKEAINGFGEEAALKADSVIRDALAHPTTGLSKMYAQGIADWTTLAAASTSASRLTPADILRAKTRLEIARAPKINGKYVMVLPPQVSADIMNDPEWREVIRAQNADKVFKGEIGELFGVKIVEATNPFREAASGGAEGTHTDAGDIYTSFVLGADAFGVVDMQSLGGSPFKPQIIILAEADKSDRLNQYISAGWKSYWGTGVLNPTFGVSLRSKSKYVA